MGGGISCDRRRVHGWAEVIKISLSFKVHSTLDDGTMARELVRELEAAARVTDAPLTLVSPPKSTF